MNKVEEKIEYLRYVIDTAEVLIEQLYSLDEYSKEEQEDILREASLVRVL